MSYLLRSIIFLFFLASVNMLHANTNVTISGDSQVFQTSNSMAITNGVIINGQVYTNNSTNNTTYKPTTITRDLDSFVQIENHISANTRVILTNENKIILTGESSVIKKISTKVQKVQGKSRLIITAKQNYQAFQPLIIEIHLKAIDLLIHNGSGNIDISNIKTQNLTLVLNGSGEISANGKTHQLKVFLEGAGNFYLPSLKSIDAYVSINGSGDVDLFVTNKLDAIINGNGVISYNGMPKRINQRINGVGEIISQDYQNEPARFEPMPFSY